MKKNQGPSDSDLFSSSASADEYAYRELKRRIKGKGLLNKQPLFYTYKITITLLLFLLGLTTLLIINNVWIRMLDAVYLGFASTQIALLAHDAGHRQIAHMTWRNDIWGLLACLLIGSSYNAWIDKHNRHHSNPNHIDLDPDTRIPFFSFTEEQAQKKKLFSRFIAKYEAYFLLLFLLLLFIGFRIHSVKFLLKQKGKYFPLEVFLLCAHFFFYFYVLFQILSPLQVLYFFVIHQLAFSLYAGSIFAPNHKGMLVIEPTMKLDFFRKQVLTSRNIKSNPFIDFWYGGLNYQIEHHLFPGMPRNRLKDAQPIIQAFCQATSTPYHETTVIQSIKEIFSYTNSVGHSLRVGLENSQHE